MRRASSRGSAVRETASRAQYRTGARRAAGRQARVLACPFARDPSAAHRGDLTMFKSDGSTSSGERDAATAREGSAGPPSDDRLAMALRGFGPLGILAMLVILLVGNATVVPLGALLVLAWVRSTRTPWRDIGYVRPRSWTLTIVCGIAAGIAFKL